MGKQPKEKTSKKDTRDLIITTAFRLFSEQGYQETSVATIAREAGISKGLMYHYFSSKEELLKGIFTHYQRETIHKMEWNASTPPLQLLRSLVDLSFDYLQRQTQIRKFSLLLTLQNPVSSEIKEMIDAGKKQWETAFTEIFQSLGYHQPAAEAFYLSALLDGISLRYLASPHYPLNEIKSLIYRNYTLS